MIKKKQKNRKKEEEEEKAEEEEINKINATNQHYRKCIQFVVHHPLENVVFFYSFILFFFRSSSLRSLLTHLNANEIVVSLHITKIVK